MKKTSRRAFNKQLATALATLPLASVVTDAQRRQRPQGSQRPKAASSTLQTQFKSEHNTPPPGSFMGGSLVFETFSAKDDWESDGAVVVMNGSNRRKWSVKPRPYEDINHTSPTNIYIRHVKFVDGAGEMVFPPIDNTDKVPIEITATLRKKNGDPFGDIHLTATGDHFEIDVPDTKRLRKKLLDSPANSRRQRVRYMHRSGISPDECDWVGLNVKKGGMDYYNNPNLPALPGYDETIRVMIWWENR